MQNGTRNAFSRVDHSFASALPSSGARVLIDGPKTCRIAGSHSAEALPGPAAHISTDFRNDQVQAIGLIEAHEDCSNHAKITRFTIIQRHCSIHICAMRHQHLDNEIGMVGVVTPSWCCSGNGKSSISATACKSHTGFLFFGLSVWTGTNLFII